MKRRKLGHAMKIAFQPGEKNEYKNTTKTTTTSTSGEQST